MKNRVKDGYADGKECINQLFDINYRFKKILIFLCYNIFSLNCDRQSIKSVGYVCST